MTNITCLTCKESFRAQKNARYCKPSCRPSNRREHNLLSSYGLTLNQYNKMFESQNGLCLGCYKHQSEFTYRLFVDHCHKTGKIRGLLCSGCNRALGGVHDVPDTLRRLADYLEPNV